MTNSWLELDAVALKKNIEFFQGLLGHEKTCFVIKSNAYGHGLKEIYQILEPLTLPSLGVNTMGEACLLRRWGFKSSVIILASIAHDAIAEAAEKDIEHFIANKESLEVWRASPHKSKIHLKFNTGLNRQGLPVGDAEELARQLAPYKSLVVGICTHFANVEDVSNNKFARTQLSHLAKATEVFKAHTYQFRAHAASSAAAMILPESRLDLVRIGISLYGLWPSALTKLSFYAMHHNGEEVLHPVLSWKAPIVNVHRISAGQFVGYGCTFKASHAMDLALLAVGYFEGYPRLAAEQKGCFVLIKGARCPLVGRISMNMLVVDVSEIAEVKVGDCATLLGSDGDDEVTADDLARWAHTINYEVVSRINGDLPRVVM